MSMEHDSWTVEREYAHPPDKVFAAWADPSVKVRWFDLSGAQNPDYSSDFRVGGAERFRTRAGSSPAVSYDAEYRDIVDNERIVSTYELSTDGRLASVSVATLELTATATGTRVAYTEHGVFLDGLDTGRSRRTGTESQLELLETVLKEQA